MRVKGVRHYIEQDLNDAWIAIATITTLLLFEQKLARHAEFTAYLEQR